jgi:DNA-directed RNA polymerase subunit omega
MARVTVEDCLNNVDSRFALVHLAVRRVLQLRHGAVPTMENEKDNKEVVLALREIAATTITPENIMQFEEIRPAQAQEPLAQVEAQRSEVEEIIEEAGSLALSIDLGDSEDLTVQDRPSEPLPED